MCAAMMMDPSPCDSPPSSPVLGAGTTLTPGVPTRKDRFSRTLVFSEAENVPFTCSGPASLFGDTFAAPSAISPQIAAIISPTRETSMLTCRVMRPLTTEPGLRHALLSSCQTLDQLQLAASGGGRKSSPAQDPHTAFRWLQQLQSCLCYHGNDSPLPWRQSVELHLFRLAVHLGRIPVNDSRSIVTSDERLTISQLYLHTWITVYAGVVSTLQQLSSLCGYSRCQQVAVSVPRWLSTDSTPLWRVMAHLLIWQLLARASHRSNEIALHQWPQKCAFSCHCEKSVWLLLLSVFRRGGADFWSELNAVFRLIVSGGQMPAVDRCQGNVLEELETAPHRWPPNIHLWCSWMLLSFADLFQWADVVAPSSESRASDHSVSSNYSLILWLSELTLEGIDCCSGAPVGTVVSAQILIGSRLASVWGSCDKLATLMWQQLWRRLSTADCSSARSDGADGRQQGMKQAVSVSRLAASAVPECSLDWLSLCSQLPDSSSSLAVHVCWLVRAHLTVGGAISSQQATRCWRILAGRVLLKLHAKKALELSLSALVDCISVLLVLLQTSNDDRMPAKLVNFLSLLSDRGASATILAIRAHFATIRLLLRRRLCVDVVVTAVSAIADCTMRCATPATAATTRAVAGYLDESNTLLQESDQCDAPQTLAGLYTDGWRSWLLASGSAERCRCISALITLVTTACSAGWDCQRFRALIPAVQSLSSIYTTSASSSTSETAAVLQCGAPSDLSRLAAAIFSALSPSCSLSEFCGDSVQPAFSAAFLCHVLSAAGSDKTDVLEQLSVDTPAFSDRDCLLHEWLRCFALAGGGGDDEDDDEHSDSACSRGHIQTLTELLSRRSDTSCALPPPSTRWQDYSTSLAIRLQQLAKSGRASMVNSMIGKLDYLRSWQRNGGPSGRAVGVRHLYRLFGSLVSCLLDSLAHQKVVLIFNTLILPPAVYDRDRAVASSQLSAIADSLCLYMSALSTGLSNDCAGSSTTHQRPFYIRCVRDVFVCYLHRLGQLSRHVSDAAMRFNPLAELLLSTESCSDSFRRTILQHTSAVFLRKKNNNCHVDLTAYVSLLLSCVRAEQSRQTSLFSVTAIIAEEVTVPLLECLLSTQPPSVKRVSTDLISALNTASTAVVGDAIEEAVAAAINCVIERHLAFSSAAVLRLLLVLCVLFPAAMRRQLTVLREAVIRVELKRGVGRDSALRAGLDQISGRLAVPTASAAQNNCG